MKKIGKRIGMRETIIYIFLGFFFWEVIFLLAGIVGFQEIILAKDKERMRWFLEVVFLLGTASAGIKLFSLATAGKILFLSLGGIGVVITPHLAGIIWWLGNILALTAIELIAAIYENKGKKEEAVI